MANYQRDGPMTVDLNQEGAPNYFPNSFTGPDQDRKWSSPKFSVRNEIIAFQYSINRSCCTELRDRKTHARNETHKCFKKSYL